MTIEQMHIRLAGAAQWLADLPFGHASWTCAACNGLFQEIENWALQSDLMTAEQHRPTVDLVEAVLNPRIVVGTVAW